MKKHLLLGLATFAALSYAPLASAEPIVWDLTLQVDGYNGATHRANGTAAGWAKYWQNSTYADIATVKFTAETDITSPHPENCPTAPNVDRPLKMIAASTTPYDYVLSINEDSQYYISGYSFTAIPSEGLEESTINGEVLGAEGRTFSASGLDENTKQYTFTLAATASNTTGGYNIVLRDFVVTLSPIPEKNAAGKAYYARELNDKYMMLSVNGGVRFFRLNDNHNGLSYTGDNIRDEAGIWHSEFVHKTAEDGTDLSGLRISSKGVYLGKLPTAASSFLGVTTDPEEAGLFRFYIYSATEYGFSCTEDVNGDPVNLLGFGTATETGKNVWIQLNNNGAQRWGSGPTAAKWTIEVVDQVEFTLNCDGVTTSAFGIPGESISTANLTDLPTYFVPAEGTITVPEAGGVVDVPGTWQFPFEFNKPYLLTLRQATGAYNHAYYDGTNLLIKNVADVHKTLNPYLVWYMKDGGVVNNTKTVTIHSLSTEENMGVHLGTASGDLCTIVADTITNFAVNNNGEGFTLRVASSDNAYINDYQNGGLMATWAASGAKTEAGSRMWATALTDADFNVETWLAHDGFTYTYDADKLQAARTNPTIETLRELFAYEPITDITREELIENIANDQHFNDLCSTLAASNLFTAEEASEFIYAKLNIPMESNNFIAELETAKATLNGFTAGKLVAEFINGKKVAFRNYGTFASGHGYMVKGTANNKIGNGRNITHLTYDAVWVIDAANDGTFTMKNLADGKYAKGLDVTEDSAEAVAYKFANENVFTGTYAIQNPAVSGNNFLNNNENDMLRYHSAGSSNQSSFWTIELINDENEQGFISEIENHLKNPQGITFGNTPGTYTVDTAAIDAMVAELQQEFDYPTADEYNNSFPYSLFDMHSIEGIALVRIKDNHNRYMTDAGSFSTTDNTGDESIFVLENVADGIAALSSLSGHYLTKTTQGNDTEKTYLRIFPGEDAEEIAHNTATEIKFFNDYTGISLGNYAIGFESGNGNAKCILASVDGNFNHFSNSDHYRTDVNDDRIHFGVEYVNTLTIEVDGNKLWRAPVAVSIADAYSYAYVVSGVDGTSITTTQADNSSIYGAGTFFLLTGNVTFNVHNGDNIEAPAVGVGHHAKQMHTLLAGKVYIYIHADDAQEPARVAAQKAVVRRADSTEPDRWLKMDVIAPETDTEKMLNAHEALIEADNNPDNMLKTGDTMDINLGQTSTVSIEEITAKDFNANTVYDLMGRRLAAPVKGINIVDGKKIMVK